jgi:hypothetical protein
VNLDEALTELGIEYGASADDARRAYLRLLKTRKPEVDREGFMRLREAYEVVRERPPFLEAPRQHHEETPREVAREPQSSREAGPVDEAPAHRDVPLPEPEPDPRATLHMLLSLHERGALAEAAALQATFVAWLDTTGLEAQIFEGDLLKDWSVARELTALPDSFPQELRSAIARSALDGSFSYAMGRCAHFHHGSRRDALGAAKQLRAHAPALAGMFEEMLDPSDERFDWRNVARNSLIVALLLVLFAVPVAIKIKNARDVSNWYKIIFHAAPSLSHPAPAAPPGKTRP